jgi:transposase
MTTTTPVRMAHDTTDQPALFLAFELGINHWKLGCTTGAAQRPRERSVPARDMAAGREENRTAKERFGVPADTQVVSCYGAGRDGFWLHRCLVVQGVENFVVDSSSIAVNRRDRPHDGPDACQSRASRDVSIVDWDSNMWRTP